MMNKSGNDFDNTHTW